MIFQRHFHKFRPLQLAMIIAVDIKSLPWGETHFICDVLTGARIGCESGYRSLCLETGWKIVRLLVCLMILSFFLFRLLLSIEVSLRAEFLFDNLILRGRARSLIDVTYKPCTTDGGGPPIVVTFLNGLRPLSYMLAQSIFLRCTSLAVIFLLPCVLIFRRY